MDKNKNDLKKVTIYTDGACRGNPGPGAYGIVLLHGEHRKELSGGFRMTTNNRMEILAAVVALQTLKSQCSVTLFTDSALLFNSMSKGWARNWQMSDWQTKSGMRTNADLWQQLLELCDQHAVTFFWLKGHAGQPENERADALASETAQQGALAIDKAYEDAKASTVKPN